MGLVHACVNFLRYWRIYSRFLKEINRSRRGKKDIFEEIMLVWPLSFDEIVRISVSGIKRGSADGLADIYEVVMAHRPQGLFCLYRSRFHEPGAFKNPRL